MQDKSELRFRRVFDWIDRKVPEPVARFFKVLRSPRVMLIRIPLAVLLVIGGIFSILPVLGIWMLPLGLLLLAVDLPFLRGPLSALILRTRRWWASRRQKRARR